MTPADLQNLQALIRETCAQGSPWIPAVAGIVGAAVGSLSSFLPNMLSENHRARKEALLVESALLAEMSALLEIAEERNYLQGMEEAIAWLQKQPAGTAIAYQVNVPSHYSRVYQSNAHRIGLVERRKATDIIRFHQLVDAVVQDVSAGGALHEGGSVENFQQSHKILSLAFEIGRKYSPRT